MTLVYKTYWGMLKYFDQDCDIALGTNIQLHYVKHNLKRTVHDRQNWNDEIIVADLDLDDIYQIEAINDGRTGVRGGGRVGSRGGGNHSGRGSVNHSGKGSGRSSHCMGRANDTTLSQGTLFDLNVDSNLEITGACRTPLNRETKADIALGAAHRITYLHAQGPSVSLGNIKSSNILLTKSYEAHVSDFGLAQLTGLSSTSNYITNYREQEATDPREVLSEKRCLQLRRLITGTPSGEGSHIFDDQ
ncbi:putative inactive receptor kinase [Capsicum chinense]|nr:putative inactive receptor kinase [Capsicum chinense]